MATMRGPTRLPVGSAAWVAEERSSAHQIAQSEVEEFSFSARNDVDWLNEHMAEIFSENQINVAEIFKTPGKLRGKTPRTTRKANPVEGRVPLSDIFSTTPKGAPNPFALNQLGRQTPKLKIAESKPAQSSPKAASPERPHPTPKVHTKAVPPADSGYYGSQSQEPIKIDELEDATVEVPSPSPRKDRLADKPIIRKPVPSRADNYQSPMRQSLGETATFHSAKEEQTRQVTTTNLAADVPSPGARVQQLVQNIESVRSRSPVKYPQLNSPKEPSPVKTTSQKASPIKPQHGEDVATQPSPEATVAEDVEDDPEKTDDEARSASDGSSPIRPIVRKSSLNFASLPAREPLTNKSLGGRISRTSQLDHRASYYNRHTGGKSLGNNRHDMLQDDHDDMDIDMDDDLTTEQTEQRTEMDQNIFAHHKTYTQRLQDQINMLGKSQPPVSRPSKSVPSLAQQASLAPSSQPAQQPAQTRIAKENTASEPPKKQVSVAPGAFPEDDDDEWIAPPTTVYKEAAQPSPRPNMAKSYSTDVMEGVHNKDSVSGAEFVLPKQRLPESRPGSPQRGATTAEKTTNASGHNKSASVPAIPFMGASGEQETGLSPKKAISVSNPTLATVLEAGAPATPSPPKSPSRGFRDSPLKQVKNKLSSILKSSKGLLASSAAISAEGKSSMLSPSTTKLGYHVGQSTESIALQQGKDLKSLYPDLSQHPNAETKSLASVESPTRPISHRTRSSLEKEEKKKEKEAKEAKRFAEQNEKLEKAREKEREKARVFSKEQEKIAAMEKQLAAQKPMDKPAQTPAPKQLTKATRASPRKTKQQAEADERLATDSKPRSGDDDVEMTDAPSTIPPPSAPRSTAPATKSREIKRPVKPSSQVSGKSKQAPTLIRVNTGSQHPGYHPSNNVLSSTLHDTLGPSNSSHRLTSKASQASLHTKPSLQSLKSSASSTGRPKALELAAKRKEQEEREAQRKREAKEEIERKRAARQEEERRQEQQRRVDGEKQKDKERDQVEAKKQAQRQAAIERAKQTRAPPPAARSHANGAPEYVSQEKAVARPPSRLGSTMHRSQEEPGRPVNAVLSNAAKIPPKRPLPHEATDDGNRPGPARNGPSNAYQAKEGKRMRMTDEFDDDDMDMDSQPPNIKGPPVRPSGGFKKELPPKSMFSAGYTNAPQGATRDLFKATVTAQHNSQAKAAHPVDMAQFSKGAIPFAANPNPAGPSSHKTPARPGGMPGAKSTAKSTARASPRFQNGEQIELPEIQTDDEDDSDEGENFGVAAWADSPALRTALVRQETVDPMQIFGPPAPLNMEEVFSKSKERFQKFRARTSSANWSGTDRLTEEDIRKDLAARDKMRREGGWSYELSKDMV